MPETPSWAARLPEIESLLLKNPTVPITSHVLEQVLKVSRRRAQQIIAPCRDPAGYYLPDVVIERLRALVGKIDPEHEAARRKKFASTVQTMAKEKENALMVAAPTAIVNQQFEVEGVTVSEGEIRVSFSSPIDAMQKLLALAMAMKNQPDEFECLATGGGK